MIPIHINHITAPPNNHPAPLPWTWFFREIRIQRDLNLYRTSLIVASISSFKMAAIKSSTNLKSFRSNPRSISFATSSQNNPTESLPAEQRWWTHKYHLGPKGIISSKKRNSSTRSTSVTFQTPTAGSAIISHVAFAPNAIKGNPYQMAITSGPRVCLYGGSATSSLNRALARGRAKDEDDEAEEPTSLFGNLESGSSVKPDRTLNTGGQPAHHAAYHRDGRLLAVGCDHGLVRICDATSRATLRTFATHGSASTNGEGGFPIRCVGWLPESKSQKAQGQVQAQKIVWSAGDDATLRVWDLSGNLSGVGDSARPVAIMRGHGDAIRACVALKHDDDGEEKIRLVTGSYDHTIRVWDCDDLATKSVNTVGGMNMDMIADDDDKCLSIMDHGAPVEALLVVNPTIDSSFSTPLILSAGGTTVKLWNPQSGACISTIKTKHSKTITSLCLTSIQRGEKDGDDEGKQIICRRLITAGLDGLIRIHSADSLFDAEKSKDGKVKTKKTTKNIPAFKMPFLHGVKTKFPITALAMGPDGEKLVIGTTTGHVTVRQKAKYVAQGVKRKANYQPRAGTYSFFMRGAGANADADDHVVQLLKKKKLKKYDVMLQKFRYADALDEALAARDPNAIVAVLEELGRRKGLVTALSNRDEETLEPLLSFTASFISNPKYTPILIGVANQLCDIYSRVFGQSDTIDEYFEKLHAHVKNECGTQSVLNHLIGQIDAVMYAAEVDD